VRLEVSRTLKMFTLARNMPFELQTAAASSWESSSSKKTNDPLQVGVGIEVVVVGYCVVDDFVDVLETEVMLETELLLLEE